MLSYASYYLFPIALPILLYARGAYLRFHYIADVAAALRLAPLVYKLGDLMASRLGVGRPHPFP